MKRALLCVLFVLAAAPMAAAQAAAIVMPAPVPPITPNCVFQANSTATAVECNALSAASQPLTDAAPLMANATNGTKVLTMALSGISPSTTRTWTIPDLSGTVALSGAAQGVTFGTITASGLITANGGLAATTGTFSSTLGVTGVATFTAAPVFSSGAASQTVELTAGKALTTVPFTGTGNYVKSASPTLTGTVAGASMTLSGTLGVTGATTLSSLAATTGSFSGAGLILSAADPATGLIANGAINSNMRVRANGSMISVIDDNNDSAGEGFFWRHNGATDLMSLLESGHLGLGISPAFRLHIRDDRADELSRFVNANANPFGLHINFSGAAPNGTSNFFIRGTDTVGTKWEFRSNGGLANFSANNVNLSDRQTKALTGPVESLRSKLSQIKLYRGRYLDSLRNSDDVMWTAQEIQAVDPNWVEVFQHEEKDANGKVVKPFLLGTRDNQIFMANIAVTIEHEALIVGLQQQVAEIRARLTKLEAR